MKVITRTIINMVLLLTASVVAQSVASVDTVGGVAPAYPPTAQGQEKQVPYKATYIFLASAPTTK